MLRSGQQAPARMDTPKSLLAVLPQLAALLPTRRAAVLALAAKEATSTIPIVMVHAGDPVGAGLIATGPIEMNWHAPGRCCAPHAAP